MLEIDNTPLSNWNPMNSRHLLENQQNPSLLRQLVLITYPVHLHYPTTRIRHHKSIQHAHPQCDPHLHHNKHPKEQQFIRTHRHGFFRDPHTFNVEPNLNVICFTISVGTKVEKYESADGKKTNG